MADNPTFTRELPSGDSIEVEVVMGGLNIYNYDEARDDSVLTILSREDTEALLLFLNQEVG